ncbi:hypothetical protein GSY71_10465 [Pusillimonas sp. TS35]|nr:hypothetical protein [Pusillimonas sp. TS35]
MPPVSDAFTPASQHDDDTRYLRNADSAGLIKDLERGRWAPQAVLDLHGDTLEQARERLDRFLASCLAHNIRCVRIIHGKGYGSRDGQPVLRSALRRWLTQLATVQAYAQCNEEDGGAGAVHVLLD